MAFVLMPCLSSVVMAGGVEIGPTSAAAYRLLPTGVDFTGRTGVVAQVQPFGEAFVVIETTLTAPKASDGQQYTRVSYENITLTIGDATLRPIGTIDPSSSSFQLPQNPKLAIENALTISGGWTIYPRFVFDASTLKGSPWMLQIGDTELAIDPPDTILDFPPHVDEMMNVDLLDIRTVDVLAYGAGLRHLNRVIYRNPTGVILEVNLKITAKEDAETVTSCGDSGVALSTPWFGLRDKSTGHYVQVLGELDDQWGRGLGYSMNRTLTKAKPTAIRLYFAVPEGMKQFDVLLLGHRVATGSVGK